MQYRLVNAEKQLLEQTLSGSIQVLTEVLSLVNPAAFGRAERARHYIHHIVTSMKLPNVWQYEVAAMMSQLGCVTLAPEMIEAVYKGETLSPNEQAQYDAHPSVAYDRPPRGVAVPGHPPCLHRDRGRRRCGGARLRPGAAPAEDPGGAVAPRRHG